MTFYIFQGWPMYAQLLIDLFKFLAPFLRNVELTKSIQILYRVSRVEDNKTCKIACSYKQIIEYGRKNVGSI